MTDETSSPSQIEKQPKDDLNNRVFFKLFQLGNTLQSKSVSELGITTVQWAVLGALSAADLEEGISFGELAEYLIVSRQNLDGVLKRLERDGHVVRVQNNIDKRSRNVMMTKSGATFWRTKEFQIYDFYRQATDSFSQDDRISLVHFFNKLQPDLLNVKLYKEG